MNAGADDDEQGRRHEQLASRRRRDQPEQRPQQQPADDDDQRRSPAPPGRAPGRGRRAASRPCGRPGWRPNSSSGTTARSCASRMAKLARPAAVVSRRWLDSTSMTMAVDDRARHAPMIMEAAAAVAEQRGDAADDGRAQDDLQAAQPEHQPAHGHEALEGQLQADQEHQEHDAELGDAGDVLGVGDRDPVEERARFPERAQAERPEDRAGRQVAQHRAHAPALHERHDDAGGAEHHQRVAVGIDIEGLRGHGALVVAISGLVRPLCMNSRRCAGKLSPGRIAAMLLWSGRA